MNDLATRSSRRGVGPEVVQAARTAWRRSQIVDAATQLMEERGFHEMSVSALAKKAGLSVGTIYQYVKDKNDILLLVIVDILEAYQEELPEVMRGQEDPVERLAVGFTSYCRVVASRRYATVLTYRESKTLPVEGRKKIMALEVETTGLLKQCLDDAVAAELVLPCDTELIAHNLTVLAHAWALKHWRLKRHIDLDTYVARELALTLKAIVAPDHADRYRHITAAALDDARRARRASSARPRR